MRVDRVKVGGKGVDEVDGGRGEVAEGKGMAEGGTEGVAG